MMKKIRIKKIFEIFFCVLTFSLLVYRVTLHADIYDEIINLNISYRIALGDVPFYNCWEAFQSGDIFMAPFIWLYLKIFGTTSGLILFSRLVYLGVMIFLGFMTYLLLSKYIEKAQAFFISYIVLFFELYSLFYLWYDTVSVALLLFGDIIIVLAIENSKTWFKRIMLIIAGVVHCAMAFSYPSFVLVAIIIALIIFTISYRFYNNFIKESIILVVYYALGAIFFIGILLLYFHCTAGMENVFDVLKIITGTRGTTSISILDIFRDIIIAYVSVNKYLIPISIVCLILYFVAIKNQKVIKWFLVAIIVLPAFNQLFIGKNAFLGLANYLSYITFWCPFLYYILNEKKKFDKCLLGIFYLPSIVSLVAISSTSVYADIGPVKCWQACLPGAIASLVFYVKIWKQKENNSVTNALIAFVTIVLLINSYSYIYLNQPYIKMNDKRIVDGLYWGIKVNPNMGKMPELQCWLQEMTRECETITVGARLRSAYMMTNLRPLTWSVESPWYYKDGEVCWEMELKYYEYFNEYPDVICVEETEIANAEICDFLNDKYYLRENKQIGDYNIFLYIKCS